MGSISYIQEFLKRRSLKNLPVLNSGVGTRHVNPEDAEVFEVFELGTTVYLPNGCDIDATKEDQRFKTYQNYDLCPNGNHQDRGFILRTSGWPFLKYSDDYFSHLVEPKEDEGFVYLTPVKPGEKPEVVFLVSFTGIYETFYDDGAPNSTIEMVDGLLHGESLHFDRNSNLISNYQFSKGLKHGIAKTYYPGKVIKSVTPWVGNKRHGEVLRHLKNGDTRIYTYKHGVLVEKSN